MTRIQTRLLALAGLSGLGASLAAYVALTAVQSRLAVSPRSFAEILVAARDLRPGASVREGDFSWRATPADAVLPGMVARRDEPEAASAFVGASVRAPLKAGEAVSRAHVLRRGDPGWAGGLLSRGMRGVALSLKPEDAGGGHLQSGDRVDVMLSRRGEGGHRKRRENVLRGVRVLDAGGAEKPAGRRAGQLTVLLELTPAQAELLAAARRGGEVSLALAGPDAPEAAAEAAAAVPARLVKFGAAAEAGHE